MKIHCKHQELPGARLALGALTLAAALGTGPGLLAQSAPTNDAAGAKKPTAANPADEPANWITLGVGGVSTSGNRAQFQERWGKSQGVLGGLQDFHYELMFGEKGMLELDGKAMYGQQDFSVKLGVASPDVGFLRAGFKQSQTWYDGSGGYYPATGKSISLYSDELSLKRGEYWIEGGLTPPDGPMLTLKLAREYRKGTKDSIIWGDSTQGGTARGMVPSFRELDELRNIVIADLKHTLGKSDVGFGVRLDMVDNNDALKEHRKPGEAGADRYVTQRELFKADMLNFHGFTETHFNDAVLLTTGYSYTRLDTGVGGSRIYGPGYDAVYSKTSPNRQFHDEGFYNLSGGSIVDQYVMNLSLRLELAENLVLVPSLRAEKIDTTGSTTFTETAVGAGPGFVTAEDHLLNSRQNGFVTVSEAMEARYTGFQNWVLYTRGEWSEGDGYLRETEQDVTTATTAVNRSTDSERFTQKYTFGANWYPLRKLHFSGQFYHKSVDNDYTHLVDSTLNTSGDRYPAYLLAHKFSTDNFNLRATWRPLPNVTSVTRYDYQISTVETFPDKLVGMETAQTTAHIISQTLTWVPWSRLFLQGTFSYALDSTTTPVSALTGGALGLVSDARNDYWQATAAATFVVDDKTDLQANYFYYRANNFINNSAYSMPYGTSGNDHTVNVSLSRNFSKAVKGTLSYGYFRHRDETSGGLDNYTAHLLFSSLTYRF